MASVKVSDQIALFLKEQGIRHVFGIVGAANAHIFDSINSLEYTQIVCVHHEQAATMAMQTYYRTCGKITAAIVTAGGGSSNAVTGVVSAWADSIPGVVISGQENVKHVRSMLGMRMWGVQGFDIVHMVKKVTKYAVRVMEPENGIYELEKAFSIAGEGRPGPVWVDYPMDIQGALIDEGRIRHYAAPARPAEGRSLEGAIERIVDLCKKAKRPVLWLGNGIRLAGAADMVLPLLEAFSVPAITAWAGLDLLAADHPLNYGHAGNYGNRAANFIVQNADLVIAIGTRLTLPMIGYDHNDFARDAKIAMVDIDPDELDKLSDLLDISVKADAGRFVERFIKALRIAAKALPDISEWRERCDQYLNDYPLVGPEHADANGYINSYRFIDRLYGYLKPDQIITTDMGTALLSGHEAMRIRQGQRMMTSTGLGEMGYGLPAAIGASFARDKGEVVCLDCDGGMMMNLQEIQTIVHHSLPIKVFIFNNDGYLMIKHTQKNLFKGRYTASNRASGVSCPDFSKLAVAFGIHYFSVRTWEDFDRVIPLVMSSVGPLFCEVFMDPEQYFYPKQGVVMGKDGKIVSPPLEDLSPLLPRSELRKNMIIGLHEKSESIGQ